MKKLLLGALLLLLSISVFSQDKGTFVRKYTSYVVVKNNVYGKMQYSSVSVVYNEENTNDIGIYFNDGKIVLYSLGNVEEGKTNNGQEYQFVKCISKQTGGNVGLQLFTNTLRLFTNESYTDSIEFYN